MATKENDSHQQPPGDTQITHQLSDVDLLMPNVTIPLMIIYPFADSSQAAREHAVSLLRTGLDRVATQFPIMNGQVYTDPASKRPFVRQDSQSLGAKLRSKGVSQLPADGMPTFDELKATSYAPPLLALTDLLPVEAFDPHAMYVEQQSSLPACIFQANFIRGGMILGCGFNHLLADIMTIEMFLKAWAAVTRDPGFRADVLLDRSLLTASSEAIDTQQLDKIENHLKSTVKCAIDSTIPSKEPAPKLQIQTALVSLSKAACQRLKAQTIASLPDNGQVSTLDCVTALMWRCITRAKLAVDAGSGKSSDETPQTTLLRTVGFRGKGQPALPASYFGIGVVISQAGPVDARELIRSSSDGDGIRELAQTARSLRQDLNLLDSMDVNGLARWAASGRGHAGGRMWAAAGLGPRDLNVTSWTALSAYRSYDFGFGLPAAVRPPDLGVRWCGPMPDRRLDGGEEVMEMYLGLEVACHAVLKEDAELKEYLHSYDFGKAA